MPVNCRLASLIVVTLDDTPAMASTVSFDRMLDVVNLRADLGGGLGGLLRQRLDLGGDHGEAAAGGAGARRFDRGIERQQRGLRGDRLDQLDHGADALGGRGEAAHGEVGARRDRSWCGRWRPWRRRLRRCDCTISASNPRAASATAATSRLARGGGIDRIARCAAHMSLLRAPRSAAVTWISSAGGLKLRRSSSSMVERKRWVKKPRPAWCSRVSASRLR